VLVQKRSTKVPFNENVLIPIKRISEKVPLKYFAMTFTILFIWCLQIGFNIGHYVAYSIPFIGIVFSFFFHLLNILFNGIILWGFYNNTDLLDFENFETNESMNNDTAVFQNENVDNFDQFENNDNKNDFYQNEAVAEESEENYDINKSDYIPTSDDFN
jgi:hypothetical protein